METRENDVAMITIRVPGEVYRTFVDYKSRFKSHMSLNSLVVEAIIDMVNRHQPAPPSPEAQP